MNKKRILSLLMSFLIIFTAIPSMANDDIDIDNRARSYILGDFKTGEIIKSNNIEEVVEIASITKLMTYMVTMDEVKSGKISLDDRIVVDEDITKIKGSSLKLEIGENYSLKQLIEGSLVVSANDATFAIARYVGGTVEEFTAMMNKKAKQIGLETAVFFNPTGLPVQNSQLQNAMTTEELFEMTRYVLEKYPEILEITKIPYIEIEAKEFKEHNTNPLIGKVPEVDGLKTGFTNKAGYCLVSTALRESETENGEDLRLISVVMGTAGYEERDQVSNILINYGLENYSINKILDKTRAIDKVSFLNAKNLETEVYPSDDLLMVLNNLDDIETRIRINEGMKFPYKEGSAVGKVIVDRNGENIYETDVFIKEKVRKAGVFRRLFRKIKAIFA